MTIKKNSENAAWYSYLSVNKGFLSNNKYENYVELSETMAKLVAGCILKFGSLMSILIYKDNTGS